MIDKKKCARCQQVKTAAEFHRNRHAKSGLATRCKDCISLRGYEYRKVYDTEIRKRRAAYNRSHAAQRKAYNDAYNEHRRNGTLDSFRGTHRPYEGRFKDHPELAGLEGDELYAKLRRLQADDKRERMKKLVEELKDAPCLDCGGRFPPEAMDFDHVRGEKHFNISRGACEGLSKRLLLIEIAKCELVCSNCHRTRTKRRRVEEAVGV